MRSSVLFGSPCAALSISMERLEVCTYGKSIGEGPAMGAFQI